jgi:DNA-binding PadR family transcriptional regulator
MNRTLDNALRSLDESEAGTTFTRIHQLHQHAEAPGQQDVAEVLEELTPPGRLPEPLVKAYLDEFLLFLVACHGEVSGKVLLMDLRDLGCEVSSGTLYPHLNDLHEAGLLAGHDRVRTKGYSIADHEEVGREVASLLEDVGLVTRFFSTALAAPEQHWDVLADGREAEIEPLVRARNQGGSVGDDGVR